MKTTKLTTLFFMLFLALGVSCGKKDNNNRTFGSTSFNTPGINPAYPGMLDGIPLGQKYQNLITHPSMICMGSAQRVLFGFKFQSDGYGQAQALGVNNANLDLNNLAGVKTLYVGSTPEKDIVIVKDYGTTKDVIISLCDIDRWGGGIISAQLYGDFYGSPATSCSVNQISEFNFEISYPHGGRIPLQVAPINGAYPIEGICPFDFYSDQI